MMRRAAMRSMRLFAATAGALGGLAIAFIGMAVVLVRLVIGLPLLIWRESAGKGEHK